MKTVRLLFKQAMLTTSCLALIGFSANATVFTAATSGNFSSAATWGGAIPGSILTSDIIIVPAGVTVTLDVSLAFSGTSSLTVDGTMSSGSYATGLTATSGTLSGSGSINVDSMKLGLTSGMAFTGSVVARYLTSLGASISSSANVTVMNRLKLTSGILNFTSGSLTMSYGSTIEMWGGSLASSGSGTLYLSSVYDVIYFSSYSSTGAELSGSGLHNITLNLTGAVLLSSNLNLNGNLTLTSGSLSLNGHMLTFGASSNLLPSGSGNISGSGSSDIIVMATSGLTGTLTFATGGNTLHNLTINLGSGGSNVTLGSSVNINGALDMQTGKIKLGANNLMINTGGWVTGGSANSYIVTDGTGSMVMHLPAGTTDTFKVGTNTYYAPIVVKANTGSTTGFVSINAMNDVLANGTTGTSIAATKALVKNTWYVSSSAATGINYDMTAMWSAGMEVNGFDRTHAYISHNIGGSWDAQAATAASTSGSMYMITRTGITSLSPFMVADNTFTPAGVYQTTATQNNIVLYPNPATDVLYFDTPNNVTSAYISNLSGQVFTIKNITSNNVSVEWLPQGFYSIRLQGTNFDVLKTFIKK